MMTHQGIHQTVTARKITGKGGAKIQVTELKLQSLHSGMKGLDTGVTAVTAVHTP